MPSSNSGRPRLAVMLLAAGAAAALALSPIAASGQSAPSFSALLSQAQAISPRIAEAQANLRQAEGLAVQAGLRPNPQAALAVENVLGGAPYSGFDEAEITLQVEQTLERGGKRLARIDAASAQVEAARARLAQARADLAFEIYVAFLDVEVAARRANLAMESLDQAQEDARTAQVLVQAGREAEVRAVQTSAIVSGVRADVERATGELAMARSRLGALAPAYDLATGLSDDLFVRRAPGPVDVTLTPAVFAAAAEREAARSRIRIEESRVRPDITVSGGVRRFQGADATAFLAGISAPIPVFDRGQGAADAARADLAAADARLAAARLTAETDGRLALQEIAAAERALAAAREGEAAFTRAYELTRTGYEGGKLPLAEVTAARRSLTDSRARSLDALAARARAQASLARLHGRTPFGEIN